MFLFSEPSDGDARRFVAEQHGLPFSCREVGATRGDAPAGYLVDRYRVRLGEGEETFERAVAAPRSWRMFDLGWTRLLPEDATIEEGVTVAVLARHLGFRSLNAAWIVYLVEDSGSVVRRGFAYGTRSPDTPSGARSASPWNGTRSPMPSTATCSPSAARTTRSRGSDTPSFVYCSGVSSGTRSGRWPRPPMIMIKRPE